MSSVCVEAPREASENDPASVLKQMDYIVWLTQTQKKDLFTSLHNIKENQPHWVERRSCQKNYRIYHEA